MNTPAAAGRIRELAEQAAAEAPAVCSDMDELRACGSWKVMAGNIPEAASAVAKADHACAALESVRSAADSPGLADLSARLAAARDKVREAYARLADERIRLAPVIAA